ncbi:hypothetical protein E4U30_003598 [Claviceps sp. LM220 group G6]|nr:hypothetical protein E4U15_000356 [Claviceps sp. LM218 group G6]KAG6098747.1 hypothetical protein E4U31_004649 [Claviceps sp. LM219 group G6]KAG6100909.1 hypothetical protein E4U30_003598 [Claviceps sp. LM220 group G6]
MASAVAKDPLDALQSHMNDVLVQTGKALRASRRDSHGNLPATHMQAKLPDTESAFLSTLDSLDKEILRAMSVIERDIEKLKKKKTVAAETSPSLPQPEPVEAHSKSAMVIDIDSSPQATTETMPKEEPADNSYVATKPAAPFPDMGMSVPAGTSIAIKKNHPPSQSLYMTEAPGSHQPTAEVKQVAHAAPVPLMDANLDNSTSGLMEGHDVVDLTSSNDPNMNGSNSNHSNMNSSNLNHSNMNHSSMNGSNMNGSNMNGSNMNGSNLNGSNLNFTDMQFTLAPSNTNPNHSGSTGAATTQPIGPSYGFGMFGTTNIATAPTPINNAMTSVTTGTAATTANGTGSAQAPMPVSEPTPVPAENRRNSEAPKKEDGTSTTFSEIFTGDGPADGMDFDFSLGDGNNMSSMGGDTFDDMMNVRDNTFDSMEHGDFDTSFFGLDKADGA